MTLKQFITANKGRKNPNSVPVSHPERGFDIVQKKSLPLWIGWGWQEESWGVAVDNPEGAKPKRTRRSKEA